MVRGSVGMSPAWSLPLMALWTLCRVAGAQSSITAQCGEDVTLHCTFYHTPGVKLHRLNITWKMQRAEGADLLVHSYYRHVDLWQGQDKAYRDRTQLYREGFHKGNASLRLMDVRFQDEGSYFCYVNSELGSWSERISLMVLSDSEMERPIIVRPGEDVTLNCSFKSELKHQPLNITWKKEQEEGPDLLVHGYCSQLESQDEAYRGRTQLYPERFHEGNASLRLRDIRLEDDGFYTCHVKPKLGRFSVRMRLTVETEAALVQSPSTLCILWWIDLGVLLTILAFAALRMYSPSLRRWWPKKGSPQSLSQPPVSKVSNHKDDKEESSRLLHASSSTSMESAAASLAQSPPAHSPEGQTAKDTGEPRPTPGVQIVPKLISIMQKALEHTQLNIAIMGELGCGKSSFINAMRGLLDEDEGAAPVGEEDTMMEPKAYQHPKHPRLTFWRLPISWTQDFQPKLNLYDFSVLMGLEGFTRNSAKLALEIKRAGKTCYLVRSKVDADLDAARRSRPSTYNEKEILREIRRYCIKCLKKGGMGSPEVFLLSASELAKYDFHNLEETVEKDLPGDKKGAFILALPNISPQILQKKKEALQKQIWKIAFVSSLISVIHIPGVSTILDVTILLTCMRYHCQVFGLDDDSFTALARQFGEPARELKAVLKPQLAKEMSINVVLQLLSSVGCGILIATDLFLGPLWVLGFVVSGGTAAVVFVVAGGISLATTYVLLKNFLNCAAEGAQRTLQDLQAKST